MSEEQTQRLNGETNFQAQVLAALANLGAGMTALNTRMAAIEGRVASLELKMLAFDERLTAFDRRLTALEEKVDARLRETRPIWEAVQSQLKMIESKLDVFSHEWLELRGEINLLKKQSPPAA